MYNIKYDLSGFSNNVLRWDDALNIGIARIDDQHKQLFNLLNDTYYKIDQKAYTAKIRHEVVDYATYHFMDEEELMNKHRNLLGDEYIKLHKKQHENFITQISKFNETTDPNDVVDFILEWIITHVTAVDTKIKTVVE